MLSEREKSTLASSWYVIYARQEVSESWYYSWFIWIYDNFFTLNRALSSIKKAHEMIVSESSLLTSLVESKNIQLRQKKCDRDFFMFVFGINSIATYHLMIDDGFFSLTRLFEEHSISSSILFVLSSSVDEILCSSRSIFISTHANHH